MVLKWQNLELTGHGGMYDLVKFMFSKKAKVIREKSCGEGSLIEQDTIENVSEPNFFFNFLRKKEKKTSFYAKIVFTVYNV